MIAPCLDEPRALAFAAGAMPVDQRTTIEEHVDSCSSCRQLLAALVRRETPETPAHEPPAWEAGQRIGRYAIRERIGRGGMGSVYRADDLELGRAIAIKRLHSGAEAVAHKRLMREARSAAQLSHPNVVTVHEVGEVDGVPFLAMELVEGQTLTRWLRARPRRWREVVAMLAQAGRGLSAAHDAGLVHRDFKPDNVLVDVNGRARVADFGLASAELGEPGSAAHTAALTMTTVGLAGTPAYLAPEIVDGELPDARSDQYAFAITLFEALHGRHPFVGTTAQAMWSEMAAGRIRPGGGDVPAWLDQRIRRGLSANPADRWPSVAELVVAIEHPPRRIWPWLALGGAGVAATVAGFMLFSSSSPVDDCERGAALIDAVWTPDVRGAQAQRFAHAAPHRDAAIETGGKLLDTWSDDWRLGRRAACSAEPALRGPRLACLDQELGELRAQLAAWSDADADVVDAMIPAISALPHPQDCVVHPPPIGKTPAPLRARIDELAALARSGRPHAADAKLAQLVADAEATHDPETLAHALRAAAKVDSELGRNDIAHDLDVRAAHEAALAGDDSLMLDAMMDEVIVAIDQGHAQDALGVIDAADALVARAKLDASYRVTIERGHVLARLGKTPEAIAAFTKAIELLEPRAQRDRQAKIQLASALGALGSALGAQGRQEDGRVALGRGLAIEEAELGPDDPEVGRSLNDLANQERALERFDDASAHYLRAKRIFVAAYGEHSELVGMIDVSLGGLTALQGKYDDARKLFLAAQSELSKLPPDHPTFSAIEDGLAGCDRSQNRTADAVVHYTRAIEILEKAGGDGSEIADERVNLAGALGELEHFAESRVQIDKALVELDKAQVAPKGYVDAWNVLAELQWRAGQKSQALETVRKMIATIGDDPRAEWIKMRKDAETLLAEWTKQSH